MANYLATGATPQRMGNNSALGRTVRRLPHRRRRAGDLRRRRRHVREALRRTRDGAARNRSALRQHPGAPRQPRRRCEPRWKRRWRRARRSNGWTALQHAGVPCGVVNTHRAGGRGSADGGAQHDRALGRAAAARQSDQARAPCRIRPSVRRRPPSTPTGPRSGASSARSAEGGAMPERVAFIGLGVMGAPIAGHLARAGHSVTVYNRTAAKAARWVEQYGGAAAATPAAAAAEAAAVFVCVGNDDDVRAVTTAPRRRAARHARRRRAGRSHHDVGNAGARARRRGARARRRVRRRAGLRRPARAPRTARSP